MSNNGQDITDLQVRVSNLQVQTEATSNDVSRIVNSLKELTKETGEFNRMFAVYIQRHETNERDIQRNANEIKEVKQRAEEQINKLAARLDRKNEQIETKVNQNTNTLEGHKPVIAAVRTLNMKILGGLFGLVFSILGGVYVIFNSGAS